MDLIKTSFKLVPNFNLKRKDEKSVTAFLVHLIEDLDQREGVQLTEEIIEIYDLIAPTSFETYKNNESVQQLGILKAMLQNDGIDIDMDKFNMDDLRTFNPETMGKLMAEVADKQNELNLKSANSNKESGKKTKRQIAQEQAELQQKAFAAKSLKDIYTNLAKIVHPDKELDPVLKLEKEEWMKKLTKAYSEKDLATMLKIEHHWLNESKFNPEAASKETYDLYLGYLNERIDELEMELEFIKMNPRFLGLSNIFYAKRTMFLSILQDEIIGMEEHNSEIHHVLNELKNDKLNPNAKRKILLNLVKNQMDDFDPFDDLEFLNYKLPF
ncbi:MAG: hypothetical protein SGJ00_03710 [bacterium]|nr:hypothetical protein [bacterium]